MSAPCSPLQRRLWLLQRVNPDSGPAFNVTTATRLRGRIDIASLDAAVAGLASRHESLRTAFTTRDDHPVRVIGGSAPVRVEVRPVQDLTAALHEIAMTRFDLPRGPLWRVVLLRVAEDDAVLVLCLSHLIADGWSAGLLHRELGLLYDAALANLPAPLPDPAFQFGDWVTEAADRGDVAFWRDELAGAPTTLEFHTDRRRPAVAGFAGRHHTVSMSAALAGRVHELARSLRTTPFAVHLSAYAAVLAAWSGQRDLVIGVPFANRRSVRQESVVGPLMEVLPLRFTIGQGTTVADLIGVTWRRTMRAMANAEVGFDRIVAAMRPTRDPSRNPLFQAMFLFQNVPMEPVTLAGCTSIALPVMPPTTRLDIALDLTDSAATIEYDRELFDPTVIELVGRRYLHTLAQLATSPARAVADLDPCAPAEQELLIRGVNQTKADLPGPQLVHELVDRAANTSPDATAVSSGSYLLTYAELVDRSTAVARALIAAGVRPGDVVAIRMDRSVDLIVAQLAVLRCGAAFLPIDPAYPTSRCAEIIDDSGARLTITELGALSGSAPLPEVRPSDIAYVIYTSGSTGRPKGVMVSHRSATNIIRWGLRELPLDGSDQMLVKTPCTFDISVWEVFGPLAAGATLVLAAPDRHRDAAYVAELLADARITVTHFVPSMLRAVLGLPHRPAWPDLRYIIAGGEALPADLTDEIDVPVLNFYGPTEATVYVSDHTAGDRITANGTIPIGRPIANNTLYVLDERLRPVPLGAPGELYIGGAQVTDGYLHRPGLTASRFLPDRFSGVPGSRLYRTGDQVRRAADGTLDFLGRSDDQVKLRGFRIELGEVESTLRQHPTVADAAVEVRSESLVAHVVAASPGDAQVDELRTYLRATLPAHLVPARLQFIAELPLTTSGKLDRNQLATTPLSTLEVPGTGVMPSGPVESAIAAAWTEAIGVPVTDAGAGFFLLGGDSISSVAVVSGCHRRGVEISVRDVFEHPTVAGLAAVARVRRDSAVSGHPDPASVPASLDPVTPTELELISEHFPDLDGVLPLGPMQRYVVDRVQRARLDGLYVVCFTAAIDDERFDLDAWQQTWRELMSRHPGLRTSFWLGCQCGPVQLVHRELDLPLRVVDLRHLGEATALARVRDHEAAQRQHVIDVTDAPQWEMTVFRIAEDRYRVICRLSYLVQDGWSVSVLQNEWYPLYDAFRDRRHAELPPAPAPYATHLRRLAALDLPAGRAYWANRLAGADLSGAVTTTLRKHCTPGGGPEHQTVAYWLTTAQRQAVLDFARRERLTLFSALQGAWALLLAGLTGGTDVLFGTISSGRDEPDIARTYGSFNNMMPTPVRVNPDDRLNTFLHTLQRNGIDDRAHDHVPLPVIAADAGVSDAVDLLDTYIVHENFPVDREVQARFARWRPDIAEMRTEHALRMLVWPVGELSLHLSFDARILSESDGRALLDGYTHRLIAMAANPQARLADLITDPLRG
ncbi:non-ribosomal peptide synthetase [Actinophytocola sp.]|uniref:non-ribosomal peptide synthetase n=1 Tax=Actinophytocola sp. TaxID=1872138 RepID=UPI003D6B224D